MEEIIINALDIGNYEGTYGEEGIYKIIDTWKENKGPLIDFLRKQENWDEGEMVVALDIEVNVPPEKDKYVFSIAAMADHLLEYLKEEKISAEQYVHAYQLLTFMQNSYPQECLGDKVDTVKDLNECCGIGQKKSPRENQTWVKYLGQALRTIGIFDERLVQQSFATISDSIRDRKEKTKLVLSVNPADYLLMSRGNSWDSCHRINGGEFMAGTVSYLLDGVTMVAYIIPADSSRPYYKHRKINRTLVMYDVETTNLLVSRAYPNEDYKDVVTKTVQDILGGGFHDCPGEFPWKSSGLHYEDYNHFADIGTFSKRDCRSEENRSMQIGHHGICINCGDEVDKADQLVCYGCTQEVTCTRCENVCSDIYEVYSVDEGYTVELCEDCCDRYISYCEYHERDEIDGNPIYVMDYGWVCEDALDEMVKYGYAHVCTECEEYFHVDGLQEVVDGDGVMHVCDSCFMSVDYYVCKVCNGIHNAKLSGENEVDGVLMCDMALNEMENSDQ